jgi:hypothetical protein
MTCRALRTGQGLFALVVPEFAECGREVKGQDLR